MQLKQPLAKLWIQLFESFLTQHNLFIPKTWSFVNKVYLDIFGKFHCFRTTCATEWINSEGQQMVSTKLLIGTALSEYLRQEIIINIRFPIQTSMLVLVVIVTFRLLHFTAFFRCLLLYSVRFLEFWRESCIQSFVLIKFPCLIHDGFIHLFLTCPFHPLNQSMGFFSTTRHGLNSYIRFPRSCEFNLVMLNLSERNEQIKRTLIRLVGING